jgi:hypothetical protein
MIEKFGGRKFFLALVAVLVGTVVEVTTTRGVSGAFAGLLAGIVAAFGAANAAITNKAMTLGAGDSDEEVAPQVDLTPVTEKLKALESMQAVQQSLNEKFTLAIGNLSKKLSAAMGIAQQ